MTCISDFVDAFPERVVAFLVVYCRCFVRIVERRNAAICKRLCDYSHRAMRIVGRRDADFYAFMGVCVGLFGCCGEMVAYSR